MAALIGNISPEPMPRIEVHESGRFFQSTDGKPFAWLADTAWLLHRLPLDDVDRYFAARARQRFTVIMGPLLVSDRPDCARRVNDDPTSPHEPFLAHVDAIIERAAAHGLYIVPIITWGKFASLFTRKSARAFGTMIGARYAQHTNIAAIMLAGEFNHPKTRVKRWRAMAEGLRDGLDGTPKLLCMHPKWCGGLRGQTTSAKLHNEDWLDLHTIQSASFGDATNDPDHEKYLGCHNWMLVEHDAALQPSRPVLDAEPTYEMLRPDGASSTRWDAYGVRRRAWWALLAGACGVTYGANGVFQFNRREDPVADYQPRDTWDVAMDYPGALQMQHVRALMEDVGLFGWRADARLVVSPRTDDVPQHVQAARSPDGQSAAVYIPGADREVVLDLAALETDAFRGWWFSPADGSRIDGAFSNVTHQMTVRTPERGEDWVLVVEAVEDGSRQHLQ